MRPLVQLLSPFTAKFWKGIVFMLCFPLVLFVLIKIFTTFVEFDPYDWKTASLENNITIDLPFSLTPSPQYEERLKRDTKGLLSIKDIKIYEGSVPNGSYSAMLVYSEVSKAKGTLNDMFTTSMKNAGIPIKKENVSDLLISNKECRQVSDLYVQGRIMNIIFCKNGDKMWQLWVASPTKETYKRANARILSSFKI